MYSCPAKVPGYIEVDYTSIEIEMYSTRVGNVSIQDFIDLTMEDGVYDLIYELVTPNLGRKFLVKKRE